MILCLLVASVTLVPWGFIELDRWRFNRHVTQAIKVAHHE